MAAKSAINVILGAMTIGKPGHEGIRVTSIDETKNFLRIFRAHGHTELDTARVYGGGSTEEVLGEADWQSFGIDMETKLYPTKGKGMGWLYAEDITHTPADVRKGLMQSLKALNTDKIHTFYLHGPDRTTPYEETLREVNALHREGYFTRFGISNYQSWEVAQICEICKRNDWIQPTVYQGLYNALHRVVEAELIPCLRKYGISLYNFNPLAGGFLTSRYHRDQKDEETEEGSRFDPKKKQGALHRGRYWNDAHFGALDLLRPVAAKHGISESETALRWLAHHSAMSKDKGDGVIIGASSAKHLEENLLALEKGPLPDDVVEALDQGWELARGLPLKYWH
ncbi:NADP-dependent oxidoreductase domain-containing protein [Phyllosticta capitalensis]|uniref:NADP-dependent oxidoreductase domain-containing protein n=1 Tax=Phyllosticta capitalensis TaxID=121624 RepID=UPI00312D09BE